MAKESWMERMVESWKETQAGRLQEFKGQAAAMGREALEDSRAAIMGEWAGGPSAMGTPLHPTPQMIHEEQQPQQQPQQQPEMEM